MEDNKERDIPNKDQRSIVDNLSSFNDHSRTYSDCLAEALVMEAQKDKEIVIVNAGMRMESSLQLFQEKFPDRFFDHAVTFSAGLSCGGLKPFYMIPSTFVQRAYDQVPYHFHSTLKENSFLYLQISVVLS
ncbi:hypothetical protein RJ641_022248 [Dillenia turbinata]|uniref:Transketolase-like pyrimidine-binding domain-containing protein n=1 Tax=Dillenia turbinata TaxID=194707 RepID=A0AAN8YU19_9MAGN